MIESGLHDGSLIGIQRFPMRTNADNRAWRPNLVLSGQVMAGESC